MWNEKGYKRSFRWPQGVRLPIAVNRSTISRAGNSLRRLGRTLPSTTAMTNATAA